MLLLLKVEVGLCTFAEGGFHARLRLEGFVPTERGASRRTRLDCFAGHFCARPSLRRRREIHDRTRWPIGCGCEPPFARLHRAILAFQVWVFPLFGRSVRKGVRPLSPA